MSEWLTLYKGGTGEYEEKKSRFIATLEPVSSEEEAAELIASVKKKYWDAKHNCSAFIIGNNGEKTRCSDDGEPSGTAGRPMLAVLEGEHITNACVVVTRYFGGTLLGTGGLVRAYTAAVKDAVQNSEVIRKKNGGILKIDCDYNDHGRIVNMASKDGYLITDTIFGEAVTITMVDEDAASLADRITDITSGRAKCHEPVPAVYAVIDGQVHFMD
ncbi:MAG: YigZ family protein [Lachnospiraceae bacterium]|nr:YigZ family protein [Lachnospiraceae bacterium]